jgi:hypothetical protein
MELVNDLSSAGRPVNTVLFTRLNHKKIEFLQCTKTESRVKPYTSIVKIDEDPHPDYSTALDRLVGFVIEVMNLGENWTHSNTIDLKLSWDYSDRNERWQCKIEKIKIARSTVGDELIVGRSIEVGDIVFDDIPVSILESFEDIFDEAWLYCQGRKTAQLSLFEETKSTRTKRSAA